MFVWRSHTTRKNHFVKYVKIRVFLTLIFPYWDRVYDIRENIRDVRENAGYRTPREGRQEKAWEAWKVYVILDLKHGKRKKGDINTACKNTLTKVNGQVFDIIPLAKNVLVHLWFKSLFHHFYSLYFLYFNLCTR